MHNHNVIDTDIHYKIDGVSRTVTNINETKRMLVQGDHNSERLTFEIPRYVDGHDFSECNAVQIHYENTDMSEKNRSADIYDVNDLHVKEDDEDIVVLSWLVHNNATKYIGTLNFGIRFSCIAEDGVVEYAWNTTTFKGISILPGLYNSEHIAEYNSDAIASLSARIVGEKTTGHGEIFNDYENNKALSKFSKASGHKTIAASKCFLFDLTHKYTSADYNTKGEGRYYLTDVTGIEPGFEYSVVLTNNYDLNGTVLSVGENYIEVDNYKKPDNISEIITESSYIFFPYHSDLGTDTIGTGAQAEGYETFALAIASHAEGCETIAAGKYSHVEGKGTIAAYAGHAEGLETKALGLGNHAEGSGSITGGTWGSHAEGFETEAKGGYGCHSEGFRTKALASHGSHAEGYMTEAKAGYGAHAEGSKTKACNESAHAEGKETEAKGVASHAEGFDSYAEGIGAHAEGGSQAYGDYSHSEGNNTIAKGRGAHSEGVSCQALEVGAHAEGLQTRAIQQYQHVQGRYNLEDTENKYAHIVGNGRNGARSNAHTITWGGAGWFAESVEAPIVYTKQVILSSSTNKKFALKVQDDGTLYTEEVK